VRALLSIVYRGAGVIARLPAEYPVSLASGQQVGTAELPGARQLLSFALKVKIAG
jgi:hypothetical protein